MTKPRTKLTVSYQVLDTTGHCLKVISETGYNKNNIKWRVERMVAKKYGKGVTVRQIKVVEEP